MTGIKFAFLSCLVAAAGGIAACGGGLGGGGDEGDECRSDAECDGELECAGANDGPVCGIAPLEGCFDDSGCFDGNVCHVVDDACSSDGLGSECGPACTDDTDCGPALRCDDGHCVAIPCDAGFACAGREVCDPGRIAANAPVFDRHHGCFAVACTDDAACGERFCVNGTCQDSAGACREPLLVP